MNESKTYWDTLAVSTMALGDVLRIRERLQSTQRREVSRQV